MLGCSQLAKCNSQVGICLEIALFELNKSDIEAMVENIAVESSADVWGTWKQQGSWARLLQEPLDDWSLAK